MYGRLFNIRACSHTTLYNSMLLQGLSTDKIASRLKHYFTDEELDEVSAKLDQYIRKSDTLDDLVDEIEDHLAGDLADEDLV